MGVAETLSVCYGFIVNPKRGKRTFVYFLRRRSSQRCTCVFFRSDVVRWLHCVQQKCPQISPTQLAK